MLMENDRFAQGMKLEWGLSFKLIHILDEVGEAVGKGKLKGKQSTRFVSHSIIELNYEIESFCSMWLIVIFGYWKASFLKVHSMISCLFYKYFHFLFAGLL